MASKGCFSPVRESGSSHNLHREKLANEKSLSTRQNAE